MASPFRIFRKYQKTLLAVACVLLMFVFVLGSSLRSLISRKSSGGNPNRHPTAVAVSWDGGKLTNQELSMLVYKRQLVNRFLGTIEALGQRSVQDSGAELRPLRVAMVGGPDRPRDGVEEDVVRIAILAQDARNAGMRISEDEIIQYLGEVGRSRVSHEQMRAVLSGLQVGGRTASIDFMIDALRDELLAQNFLLSYQFALRTVSPEERWQDWQRVNDRVVVEAAGIPVSSFVVDVSNPTDEELTTFFDKYKNQEPLPESVLNTELPSPEPGFAIPRKVEVEYLRADFDKYVDKVEDSVTDEEIQKYYDDNKDHFIRADSGALGGAEAKPAADAQEKSGGEAAPAPAQPPAASPAAEKPATETAPAAGKGSFNDRQPHRSDFQLVAFQEDKSGEAKPDAKAAASDSGAAPTESDATQAGTAAATAPSAGQQANPPLTLPATPEAAKPEPAASAAAAPEKKPVEYQPLDEVRDQIRRQIAETKVNDQLRDKMGELETELHGAYTKYLGQVFDAEATEKPRPTPPPELADLAPMAKKNGIAADKTGPVSFLQLRDTPLGMSVTTDQNNRFVLLAFGRELELYQPVATFDLDGNRYLAMKTSDTPARVPTLDEVRDEVVLAWKMQKASELALKHAEEVAKKAQASGTWLADYFADNKEIHVARTDPFAWLTIGSVSPRTGMVDSFRLSQPDGIVAAGPDFMREAFALHGSEVGAVLNHDHTIAYVLRVVEHQNTEAELREAYLSEADQWFGLAVMSQGHMQQAARTLIGNLLTSAHLKWERTPDQIESQAE
jgi:hypothetical protein